MQALARERYATGTGMNKSLPARYDDGIARVLSCRDPVVITGTLPDICQAEGISRYLHASEVCG